MIKQVKLAEKLEVSRQYINQIFKSRKVISDKKYKELIKLCPELKDKFEIAYIKYRFKGEE